MPSVPNAFRARFHFSLGAFLWLVLCPAAGGAQSGGLAPSGAARLPSVGQPLPDVGLPRPRLGAAQAPVGPPPWAADVAQTSPGWYGWGHPWGPSHGAPPHGVATTVVVVVPSVVPSPVPPPYYTQPYGAATYYALPYAAPGYYVPPAAYVPPATVVGLTPYLPPAYAAAPASSAWDFQLLATGTARPAVPAGGDAVDQRAPRDARRALDAAARPPAEPATRASSPPPPRSRVPQTFYLIPGCYVGNVPPMNLPANCDVRRLVTRAW